MRACLNCCPAGVHARTPFAIIVKPHVSGTRQLLQTDTISNNTAEAASPGDTYSQAISGAVNYVLLTGGVAISTARSWSQKNATSDSKSLATGLPGNGRVTAFSDAIGNTSSNANSWAATFKALGAQSSEVKPSAYSPGDARAMGKALAGAILGTVGTQGTPFALGYKSADVDSKAASMVGVGLSTSTLQSTAISFGNSSAKSGILSAAVYGDSFSGSGSLALGKNSTSETITTSRSGQGAAKTIAGSSSFGENKAAATTDANAITVKGDTEALGAATSITNGASKAVAGSKSNTGVGKSVATSDSTSLGDDSQSWSTSSSDTGSGPAASTSKAVSDGKTSATAHASSDATVVGDGQVATATASHKATAGNLLTFNPFLPPLPLPTFKLPTLEDIIGFFGQKIISATTEKLLKENIPDFVQSGPLVQLNCTNDTYVDKNGTTRRNCTVINDFNITDINLNNTGRKSPDWKPFGSSA